MSHLRREASPEHEGTLSIVRRSPNAEALVPIFVLLDHRDRRTSR